MKKILSSILILFLLVGCSNVSSNDVSSNDVSSNDVSSSNVSSSNVSSGNVSSGNVASSTNSIVKEYIMEDIVIKEREHYSVNWDYIEFPVDLDEDILKEIKPIHSNKTAIDVGKNIIEKRHEKGSLSEYVLIAIVHSLEDNVWRFEYNMDDDSILCGSFFVVVDGNKGTLIIAWIEEG